MPVRCTVVAQITRFKRTLGDSVALCALHSTNKFVGTYGVLGMLAGGCAIGAGVTGGSIFVGTAWAALFFMWIGAMVTDYLVDQPGKPATV